MWLWSGFALDGSLGWLSSHLFGLHLLPNLIVVALHDLLFAILCVVVRLRLLLLRIPLFEFTVDFVPVKVAYLL